MPMCRRLLIAAIVAASASGAAAQTPMGTAFTYQGQLTEDGAAMAGTFER